MLVSDGVSDILSDGTITRIFEETESKRFLDELLLESCFGEPDYPEEDFDEILVPTLPGKDNASAAMYLKLKAN